MNEPAFRNQVGIWACVAIIIAGFAAGTSFFIVRLWWAFAVAGAIVVTAGLAALRLGILLDTRTDRLGHTS